MRERPLVFSRPSGTGVRHPVYRLRAEVPFLVRARLSPSHDEAVYSSAMSKSMVVGRGLHPRPSKPSYHGQTVLSSPPPETAPHGGTRAIVRALQVTTLRRRKQIPELTGFGIETAAGRDCGGPPGLCLTGKHRNERNQKERSLVGGRSRGSGRGDGVGTSDW